MIIPNDDVLSRSDTLDGRFAQMLRERLKLMNLPVGSRTVKRVFTKSLADFNDRVKPDFRNNGQVWNVDVGIESEFPGAGIKDGYIAFSNEDIYACFEPVLTRILKLTQDQIASVQRSHKIVKVNRLPARKKPWVLTIHFSEYHHRRRIRTS